MRIGYKPSRRRVFLGSCAVMVAGVATPNFSRAAELAGEFAPMPPEETAVIQAYLAEPHRPIHPENELLLVRASMAVKETTADFGKTHLRGVMDDAIRDWTAKSRQPRRLAVTPTKSLRFRYTTLAEIRRLDEGPRRFKLPCYVTFRFSRVGFSDDRNQAVFQVDYSCGAISSDGRLVLMTKHGTNWTMASSTVVWIQ